jgi:hypothetical protein
MSVSINRLLEPLSQLEIQVQALFIKDAKRGPTQRKHLPTEQGMKVLRMHVENRNWAGAMWVIEEVQRTIPKNEVYAALLKLHANADYEKELKRPTKPKNNVLEK